MPGPIIKKQNTFRSVPLDTGGIASAYWSTGLRKFVSETEVEWDIPDFGIFYYKRFASNPVITSTITSELIPDECIDFVDVSYWGTVTTGSWTGTDWLSAIFDGNHWVKLDDPTGFQIDKRPYAFLANRINQSSDVRVTIYDGLNGTIIDNQTIVPGVEIPMSFNGSGPAYDIDRVEFISSRVTSSIWIQSDGVAGFELTGDFSIEQYLWVIQAPWRNLLEWRDWFWVVNTVTGEGVRTGISRYLNNDASWYTERTYGGIPDTSRGSYQRASSGTASNTRIRLVRTGNNVQAKFAAAPFNIGAAKYIGPDPCILVIGFDNTMQNGDTLIMDHDNLNLLSGTYNGVNPDDDFTTLDLTKWVIGQRGGNPNNSIGINNGRLRTSTTINVGPFNLNEMKFCDN